MAPLPPDPYKILGVSKDAQTPDIRASYRKLVLKCHPDKVQDPKLKDEKQIEFQRVQQAYELLNNDAERQKYDDRVKLEDLRRQMKEKAHISSPRPSAKYSGEFEIRTPEMRSSGFKSSPSTSKVYTFTRIYEDDGYGNRGPRVFEGKSSRPSKRDSTFAERSSKRDAERERERDKDRERERRRREEDAKRAAAKSEKEAMRAEKKRQEKQREKEYKREAEEKYRQRYAKVSVESYDDEPPKSERKRSSKKHDDKGGRSSSKDDLPKMTQPPRPPMSHRFYSNMDRANFDRTATYIEASRVPVGAAPGLYRSASYSTRPYMPAAPSPPPTAAAPKKAFVSSDTDSDDNNRRSAAPPRRGSGDGPRISRERSSYRKSSNEVLDDHVQASASPAARHTASFSKSSAAPPPMAGSPPRHDLPRTNTMPQPSFSRPSPGISRAQTFNAFGESANRGRGRSRMHAQAPLESSESEEDYERHERERKARSSRRTQSPEPMYPRENVSRYQVDGPGRTRRLYGDSDTGHAYYAHPVRVSESRLPANYREASYSGAPPARYPSNVKTSKYEGVRYSDYHDYRDAVRA